MKYVHPFLTIAVLVLGPLVLLAAPRDAVPLDAPELPRDYRLHVEFSQEATGSVRLPEGLVVQLPEGIRFDVAVEHPAEGAPVLRVWSGGELTRGPERAAGLAPAGSPADGKSRPVIEPGAPGVTVTTAWMQPLDRSDHAEIVSGWNESTLKQGRQIYMSSCVTCHGTEDQPGSLPTATRFAQEKLNNGSDPHSIFTTLTEGYGQMVPQPNLTTGQKYAVTQFIREKFIRHQNPKQLTEITPDYLDSLPKGLAVGEPEKVDRSLPPYERMDIGPALFWTYEIEPENIAQKGLAVRLDPGPGGISKGRAWMVYDHDTMRVGAATSGDFVDWRGIAFDGSHQTHTRLTGRRHFVNPVGPGWASPDGSWNDPRPLDKEGRPYGPLPRNWALYQGLYLHGDQAVVAARIHGTRVLESPGWIDHEDSSVFTRTLNVGPTSNPLQLRVAPDNINVVIVGDGSLQKKGGFWVAKLPSAANARIFISTIEIAALDSLAASFEEPLDLTPLTQGGPQRSVETVTTTSVAGPPDAAFIADTFPLPVENPWQSWMRPGGFDFTPDGKGAVVAMWNGDVWRVDGIYDSAPAPLDWRRIATGLFQPLGVKFRDGELFITCRDQLARLHDLNGNGETDFIESFNNDHQVTEHFHEFAMGLQTDTDGNFYYAKSARHALDSLVPHHGTLLRVSADGSRTEILATGFRAANGVLVNDDGTFFVTDQEGHWTPKNRINRVEIGGFYGNMFGYTDVTDSSNSAMEQAMVWITNGKDRSPGELVRVPEDVWGSLGGSLLSLSYGTGRAFLVPHEEVGGEWQGAVVELPMPAFETGIMRGRFGFDGALYTSGMFAWAGSATTPGGFYRIRHSGQPAYLPVAVHAIKGGIELTFSDPLDPASVTPDAFALEVWSVERTENYGSVHKDERTLEIDGVSVSSDNRSVTLSIPDLEPTWFYELLLTVRAPDGTPVARSLHGTIHQLDKR